jgi:hypothetical protein
MPSLTFTAAPVVGSVGVVVDRVSNSGKHSAQCNVGLHRITNISKANLMLLMLAVVGAAEAGSVQTQ